MKMAISRLAPKILKAALFFAAGDPAPSEVAQLLPAGNAPLLIVAPPPVELF